MREVKFLQQNLEEPSLYLEELRANEKTGEHQQNVYTISTDVNVVDPFANSPSARSRDSSEWSKDPRCPDPIGSKKAAIVKPTLKPVSNKSGNRVTIRLPHSESKGNEGIKGAKTDLGTPISDGVKDSDNADKSKDSKPPNICNRILGGCVQKLPCCAKLACCKQPSPSQVQLVNEKAANKKKAAKTESETPKEGVSSKNKILSKINCCKKKDNTENEMVNISGSEATPNEKNEEAAPTPGCLSCCKRKNKIRDSSADRRNVAGEERWWHKILCCKSKERKEQDWAARRDSILSQSGPPPGCCDKLKQKLSCKKGASQSDESRRTSLFSKKRSLSQAVPMEDSRSKLDPSLIEHASLMRGAIPALPVPLAWICFVFNILVPGLGTICSGLFCMCFGRPRFGMYDGYRQRIGAFLINVVVGVGQLFTVLFCLVGWGWSIWWGSMMIKFARKYKKLRIAAADPERAAAAPTTNNHRAART